MWFRPTKLMVDRGYKTSVIDNQTPIFSWGAVHEGENRFQSKCRVKVFDENTQIWDSQWIESDNQELRYNGTPFKSGQRYRWSVELVDNEDVHSQIENGEFITALFEPWQASWIDGKDFNKGAAKYFRKQFTATTGIKRATMFVCGIGYHYVTVNGVPIDDAMLQPAFSEYSERCYYITIPIEKNVINAGENVIGIVIADGRRSAEAPYMKYVADKSKVKYLGDSQVTAQLFIEYTNGQKDWVFTDESWLCAGGPIVYSDMCDGETYDANKEIPGWNLPSFDLIKSTFKPVFMVVTPIGKLSAQLIEPIRIITEYKPISITNPKPGLYIVDIGQNIAGVIKAVFPQMPEGTTITIRYAETLQEDGTPYFRALRSALATDKYIASGKGNESYQSLFTYHGFRYIQIEGWPGIPDKESLKALAIYNDMDNGSFFNCSNQLINQIHKACLQTERSNIHGIATDCPQRDERQQWLNDATVRFEEMPYSFNVSRLFPKIITDIMDSQEENGAIGCTAPFTFSFKPTDPVCSSFLIAGMQCLLHYGDLDVVRNAYPSFKRWNDCLKAHTTGDLVNYTHWGDWAGPLDSCINDGGVNGYSKETPGLLMSSGYYYYNYMLLAEFAEQLGLEKEKEEHLKAAGIVQKAFLDKWFDDKTGIVAKGSEGAQAFSLWIGILPVEKRILAARKLHEAVDKAGYRLQTGNLCSRYVMDVLADWGYIEDAYKIITREEWPSLGFMLVNEGTTIWERFELISNYYTNSYNHPMYAAVDEWFYSRFAGITPVDLGWNKISIKPKIPEKTIYFNAVVDTIKGDIIVKWENKFDKPYIYLTIPFGCHAEVHFPSEIKSITSGYHIFEWK